MLPAPPMPLPGRPFSRASALLAGLLLSLFVAGCGHPMSTAECDDFIDKVVEIELSGQSVSDPQVIAQRKRATREARGKDLEQRCVGRKVTDAAMQCVRAATTYEQIDNVCLR